MKIDICDRDVLMAVSPTALSAYARIAGWSPRESYREHSDIYVGEGLPEIVVPRTVRLGDYASAVAAVIKTFAQVSCEDMLTVYRSVVTADRDIIRVRAAESDDGSVGLNDGVDLVGGARDLVLSAACALNDSRPVYQAGANREATELVRQMRLGQTDQGSFVVTLLTPVIPPRIPASLPDPEDQNAPVTRLLTRRLAEALAAAHRATERISSGNGATFAETVVNGVSANLCESLVRIIEPFPTLDVRVSWALTRPWSKPSTTRFGRSDAPLLREAARSFRTRAPQSDMRLYGFAGLLKRDEQEEVGTISLTTVVDGQRRSVEAVLEQSDYEQAVQAHQDRAVVVLKGDLERVGQRWRLLNPSLESVLHDDENKLRN